MTQEAVELRVDGRLLVAVPAVHFRVAFAEAVNRACSDPARRPGAVAVELGPKMATAVSAWLSELRARRGREPLPCMLGVARPNRTIKPSLRERAAALERIAGCDVFSLPPRVLNEALGYSSLHVVFLSPTDSIVEAIRCALELGVPLHGIDLDECADGVRPRRLLEDPSRASGALDAYVARNERYADSMRDDEVDAERERAMAARLKSVLERHETVVYTGGLAHWTRLRALLADPTLAPESSEPAGAVPPPDHRRIVVHPALAARHMDVYPALAQSYESRRAPADRPRSRTIHERVDVVEKYGQLLGAAYEAHFAAAESGEQISRPVEDLAARPDFEQLLAGLALLDQTQIPDLYTTMCAALGTMSPKFCERLATVLMDFPWAAPDEFPDLPVLAPAPRESGARQRADLLERDGSGWRAGEWVYVDADGDGTGPTVDVALPWAWSDEPEVGDDPDTDRNQVLNWPPVDQLLTAMSMRATQIVAEERTRARSERFEGSLLDGVDVKATLRAHARGGDDLIVRLDRRRKKAGKRPSDEWDPVVWIFRTGRPPGSQWDFMGERVEEFFAEGYFEEPDRIRRTIAERRLGPVIIEQAGFGVRRRAGNLPADAPVAPAARGCPGLEFYEMYGIAIYAPSHFTSRDHAAWAENTDCRRNPFVVNPSPYSYTQRDFTPALVETFRREHGLDLDPRDWPVTMVRIAVPFAEHGVTVVAPDAFSLPTSVFDAAARLGKTITVVPHSYFPRESLRKASLWIATPASVGKEGAEFPPNVVRAIGEEPDANRRLLTPFWADYASASRRGLRAERAS